MQLDLLLSERANSVLFCTVNYIRESECYLVANVREVYRRVLHKTVYSAFDFGISPSKKVADFAAVRTVFGNLGRLMKPYVHQKFDLVNIALEGV